jgi:hypothetical protein
MEVRHNTGSNDTAAAERRAVIVELWRELSEAPVDAWLLEAIRARLNAAFGDHVIEGPAAIARILADEGAELKHPEVIEADVEWRQARIEARANDSGFDHFSSLQTLTLATAEKMITELEEARKQHERTQNPEGVSQVRAIASESRRLAESIARNRSAAQNIRAAQSEIAEWLKVWLQTPSLFKEWLELRKRSDEFRARFPRLHHEDTKTPSD